MNMPYDVLEKIINSLPEAAVIELTHYVQYLTSIYSTKDKNAYITNRINEFLQKNSDAFTEFKTMEKASLSSIRELTKNDTWWYLVGWFWRTINDE